MSDLNTTISLTDDDKAYIEETINEIVERIGGALEDIVANIPDITPKHPNQEIIKDDEGIWTINPDYVRAWVRFDALGGQAMELPCGAVSWHPDIRWERHDDGRCWEVEPRRLSDRRMKQLEEQYLKDRGDRVIAAVSK